MNRTEHISWVKSRALEYANQGNIQEAMNSFFSDMRKHPETENHIAIELGFGMLMIGAIQTKQECIKFIEGTN